MNEGPALTSLGLWGRYERLCIQLLRDALADLAAEPTGQNENDLNRGLYRAIVRASHSAARSGATPPVVVPEGRNPPAASDRERAEREFKIPDFYWAYVDPLMENPDECAKQFVVECKRLATRTKDWVYTREYVESGIARFIRPAHGYAKGMASGAMVGYLQQIPLDVALDEVNVSADATAIPRLAMTARDGEAAADLDHELVRPFPQSPFRLAHVWARVDGTPLRPLEAQATE